MKSFLEWLVTESELQQKPILFVGNSSAIIPSDHDTAIKTPDSQTAERLKPMTHSVWYEGVGERKGGGSVESAWVKQHLGVSPTHVDSYDMGKIYPHCANGMGPAILLFSNLNVNAPVDQNSAGGNTVEGVIRWALAKGSKEGKTAPAAVEQFIKICRADLGGMLDLPPEKYGEVAKAAEAKMWPGGDLPGEGPLGRLADQVERERRAKIVQMAAQSPGLYFLGSGHLKSMRTEHGLPSDLDSAR